VADINFEVPLKAAATFAPKPGDALTVTIDYQGCNNNECLRPGVYQYDGRVGCSRSGSGRDRGIASGGAKKRRRR